MVMTVGMCFAREFPGAAVTEFARRLDAGGVDELWLIEDCFYTTAPPLAAAALATTERLTVGLGILPSVVRTAALTAMEIATLASIAPGRVVGGIGHGVQSWMAQMGVATPSPLTTLDEVVTSVRRLLRGETVSFRGRQVTLDQVRLDQARLPARHHARAACLHGGCAGPPPALGAPPLLDLSARFPASRWMGFAPGSA